MLTRGRIDYAQFARMAQTVDAPAERIELAEPKQKEPELLELYEHGFKRGLSTGWPTLDEFYTVRHGEMNVITGIPGHSKSSWLDNLMVNTARLHGWKWVVFSAENFPVSRHIAGIMEIYTEKPFNRGPRDRMTRSEMALGLAWAQKHFRFIEPAPDGYSLNRLIEAASFTQQFDAFVLDPWNEIDHSRPKDMREDEFISSALTKLRWMARQFGIAVFIVVHPAKFIRKHGEAKPVMSLNECKGASEWYAKADNGISLWRDEGDINAPSEVHVQKIRFREVGRIGKADLYYDRVTGKFNDPLHRPTAKQIVERATTHEDDAEGPWL